MTSAHPSHYEIDTDFLQLVDPAGHQHYLTRGRELPDWVNPTTVAQLVSVGALFEFGVI